MFKRLLLSFLLVVLAACGSQPPRPVEDKPGVSSGGATVPAKPVTTRGGGYYLDDGPGDDEPPPDVLAAIPDAVPRVEPLHRFANRPYTVLGKNYTPMKTRDSYKATGIASWYGKKFHGQKTSSGEVYDMYAMTAAHPTLPLPSYARVTNPANGKSVVVRVNDRGPFLHNRLMDLSYAAAWKLGYIGNGSTKVTVELLHPDSDASPPVAARKAEPAPAGPALAAASTDEAPMVDPSPAPGAYIQLGAFGNPDNAEAFRSHMARELDWLSERIRLEPGGKIMRVQAGPFRDRAEADAHAEKIRGITGIKPTIVMR
ncbi:MAG: septal ring lytic transglycosylase RlpA family protein [Rhodocyclaceae bacterium]|nr:septal ring lytic transglycosylase RlpA family protein [Rhodocyclaceae bacterium]